MNYNVLKRYQNYVNSFPLLNQKREAELSKIIKNGSDKEKQKAVEELVTCNMRIVLSLAQKYIQYEDYFDIVSDGNLGLVKAAYDFDSTKAKFATHATYKIKTAIRDGMHIRINLIKLPRFDSISKILKLKDIITESEKTNKQLAQELNLSIKDIENAKITLSVLTNILPIFDKEGEEIEIFDIERISILDQIYQKEISQLISKAIKELNFTKKEIALLYQHGDESLSNIAKKLNVARNTLVRRKYKMFWNIKCKLLDYLGEEEYIDLFSQHQLPAKTFVQELKDKASIKR